MESKLTEYIFGLVATVTTFLLMFTNPLGYLPEAVIILVAYYLVDKRNKIAAKGLLAGTLVAALVIIVRSWL